MNYYNEIDPYTAAWMRNLINQKLIPDGHIDTRSIVDVQPSDLDGYTHCHFFAGIAGWPLALQLAGWPATKPVWTGSCPCQPLSCAGQRKGHADERHLWPAFHALITQCRPPTVFGEQVASKDGREWFSAIRADLEGVGYAVGGADLCAASVGAPHIRQRLFWVANATGSRSGAQWPASQHGAQWAGGACGSGESSRLGDANNTGPQGRDKRRDSSNKLPAGPTSLGNPWRTLEWLPCLDGKARCTQPGLFPLAHGVPGRVGKLRAYGNAIVPQVAAMFIQAATS